MFLGTNESKNTNSSVAFSPSGRPVVSVSQENKVYISKSDNILGENTMGLPSSQRRVPFVDLLSICFGIGAWISINGVWVELPLLVEALPEGWALPSFMSIVIQIANIGPITYTVVRSLWPSVPLEKPAIYLLMVIGTLSSLLIAFFWDATSVIGGVNHSTGLLVLLFCLSLVDCSSSVLFMPFMARFRQVYLTSYLIGEGLSGLLPSLFALIQGVGGNPECRNISSPDYDGGWKIEAYYPAPNFSVSAFFFILMSMMICCAMAFIALNKCTAAKREWAEASTRLELANSIAAVDNVTFASSVEALGDSSPQYKTSTNPIECDTSSDSDSSVDTKIPRSVMFYLLAMQCWVCALSNGALPSLQSYSCLPYGNTAYHLAVTLSAMANPIACLFAYFIPITNVCLIAVFTFLGSSVSCYIIALAALSPIPPLIGQTSGEILMIASWILCVGLLTYVKVSVASILRMEVGKGNQNLFWFGVVTQVGSAIGSIISFLLVNVYVLFQSYYPCV